MSHQLAMMGGLKFILFAFGYAALCCLIGYGIDKLTGHCAMIDRIVKKVYP